VPERIWRNVALAAVTLAYPVVVYLSLGRFDPRWLALLLLAVALVRLGFGRTMATWGVVAVALTLALVAWLNNALMPVKLYPVAVNLFMLLMFATTLIRPPSAIERLARLREPDLPEVAVVYTRKVTRVWCAFFLINGGIALGTALWGTDVQWTLYNGAISYLIMGLIAAVEWVVRQRVRGRGVLPSSSSKLARDSHA
jgi:uncharacterized membrane protein